MDKLIELIVNLVSIISKKKDGAYIAILIALAGVFIWREMGRTNEDKVIQHAEVSELKADLKDCINKNESLKEANNSLKTEVLILKLSIKQEQQK